MRFIANASVLMKLAAKDDDRISGIAKRNRFDYRVSILDRPLVSMPCEMRIDLF
jgi:hypothetical protein